MAEARRRRPWRVLALVLLVLAGVVVLGFSTLERMAMDKVQRYAKAEYGLTLSWSDVDLAFSPFGVRIEGLNIQSDAGLEAKIKTLAIVLKLRPLLDRHVDIQEVLIDAPDIVFSQEASSSTSQPIEPPKTDESTEEDEEISDFRVSLHALKIRSGAFRSLDKSKKTQAQFSGLTCDARIDLVEGGSLLKIDSDVGIPVWHVVTEMGQLGKGLPIRFKQVIEYRMPKDHLKIAKSEWVLGPMASKLKGEVKDVTQKHVFVNLAFDFGPSEVEQILALIPDGLLDQAQDFSSKGLLAVSGSYKGFPLSKPSEADYQADIRLRNGRLTSAKYGVKDGKLALDAHVDPKQLRVREFKFALERSKVDVSFEVAHALKDPMLTGKVAAKLHLQELAKINSDFAAFSPMGNAQLDVVYDGPTQAWTNAKMSGRLQLDRVSLQTEALPKPVRLNGTAKLASDALTLSNLQVLVGKSDMSASGSVSPVSRIWGEGPMIQGMVANVEASSNVLDSDDFGMGESSDDETSFELPEGYEGLEAQAKLSVGKLKHQGIQGRDVRLNMVLKKGVLKLHELAGGYWDGRMNLSGHVEMVRDQVWPFASQVNVQNINMSKALSEVDFLESHLKLSKFFGGRAGFKGDVSGRILKDFSVDPASVDLNGAFTLGGMHLENHPVQNALSSYLKAPQVKSLDLKTLSGALKIRNGMFTFPQTKFDLKGVGLELGGTQKLSGALDMDVEADMPLKALGRLPSFSKIPGMSKLASINDTIGVPLSISGQANKPKVTLESQVMQRRLEAKVSALAKVEKDRLAEKLKQELKSSIKKENPKEEIKKGLKKLPGLFK